MKVNESAWTQNSSMKNPALEANSEIPPPKKVANKNLSPFPTPRKTYIFFRQWLVLGVKLREIKSNGCFPTRKYISRFHPLAFRVTSSDFPNGATRGSPSLAAGDFRGATLQGSRFEVRFVGWSKSYETIWNTCKYQNGIPQKIYTFLMKIQSSIKSVSNSTRL